MKRNLLSLCVVMLVLAVSGPARATLFFADYFSYADGELTDHDDGTGPGANVSSGLWNDHSGTGFPTSILVDNGQAVLKQGNPASEDANRVAGASIGLGETWYYAALVTVNDERAAPSTTPLLNQYFMHFKDSGNNFRGRAFVHDPNTGTGGAGYTFGLAISSGSQVSQWASDLSFGTQYKIVVSYTVVDAATSTSKLWVDPASEASLSIADTGGAPQLLSALALRQAFSSGLSTNYEVLVDAVAIGTSFDEVSAAVMIPEPSTLALAGLALVGLGRKRRS